MVFVVVGYVKSPYICPVKRHFRSVLFQVNNVCKYGDEQSPKPYDRPNEWINGQFCNYHTRWAKYYPLESV